MALPYDFSDSCMESSSNLRHSYYAAIPEMNVFKSMSEELEELSRTLKNNVAIHDLQQPQQRQHERQHSTPSPIRQPVVGGSYTDLSSLRGESFMSKSASSSLPRRVVNQQHQQGPSVVSTRNNSAYMNYYSTDNDMHDVLAQTHRKNPVSEDYLAPENNAIWSLQCSPVESLAGSVEQPTTTKTSASPWGNERTPAAPSGSKGRKPSNETFPSPLISSDQRGRLSQYSSASTKHGFQTNRLDNNGSLVLTEESNNLKNDSPVEPPDIKSPPFHLFSPPMTADFASSDNNLRQQENWNRNGINAANDDRDVRSKLFATSANDTSFDGGSSSKQHPLPTRPTSEWKPVLEDMKFLLEAKDARIRTLEEENAFLREQLQYLNQKLKKTFHRNCSEPPGPPPSSQQRMQGKERSPKKDRQTPPVRPTTRGPQQLFSPGTEFVAELASLIEIEVGHHAPLSFIIDKHWDKFSKYNRNTERYG